MDATKLSPAPWVAEGCYVEGNGFMMFDDDGHNIDEAEFIALARNAFDVMMRRGWSPVQMPHSDQWGVQTDERWNRKPELIERNGLCIVADDPFTALVEADKWYKENVDHAIS